MTVKALIASFTQQEDLNFLLTNRIPRAALTRFMVTVPLGAFGPPTVTSSALVR